MDDPFAGHGQRLPTRRQQRQLRAALGQSGDECGRLLEHVLAVVEHDETAARAEVLDEPCGGDLAAGPGQPDTGAHRDRHVVVVDHRGEIDEVRTPRERLRDAMGALDGETCLARPTDRGERHEPSGLEQAGDVRHDLVAPDETCHS